MSVPLYLRLENGGKLLLNAGGALLLEAVGPDVPTGGGDGITELELRRIKMARRRRREQEEMMLLLFLSTN